MKKCKFVRMIPVIILSMSVTASLTSCGLTDLIDELNAIERAEKEKANENDKEELTEPEIVDLNTNHIINFNDKDIKFRPVYSIEKERTEKWLFTQPSTINLSLGLEDVPEGLHIMVSQVYGDVSLSSEHGKYNGIRQDSINIEYFTLPRGGFSIDAANSYSVPFEVEAVDKSETFYFAFYGYGSSSTHRVSEADLKNVQGVVLNVVWTISIETSEGNLYMKTINDKVEIPYVENEQK